MSAAPEPTTPSLRAENVPRGTLLTLLVIPAGIMVWVILWSVGFIASIVAFGVALGGMWLYRLGSGGRLSRAGAIRVTGITIVTLLLAFVAGLISDDLASYSRAVQAGEFLDAFGDAIEQNAGAYAVPLVLALVFGALGCFTVLRTAVVQTKAQDAAAASAGGEISPGGDST
jgi:hypothetical protein